MSKGFDPQALVDASRAQRLALDPAISVWVSASAGTGKTEVLTRRLMTLLLTDPQLKAKEIVALTFTRAGAAEMSARLPERLAVWAKKNDDEIEEVVRQELGLEGIQNLAARVRALADEVLREGPVVNTIHGVAQMLLGSFPLEAGVPMGFRVVEPGEKTRMLMEIQHGLLVSGGALAEHLAVLLDELGEHGWRELTDTVIANWRRLEVVVGNGDVRGVLERLDEGLGLKGGEEWAWGTMVPRDGEVEVLKVIAQVVPGKVDRLLAASGRMREELWRGFLLTDADTPRSRTHHSWFNKKEWELIGDARAEVLFAAQDRVYEQVRLRKILRARQVTEALLHWGAAVREGYAAYKRELGMLDYDDLLDGFERLLGRAEEGLAEWVWYVLDRKFRHMVVDEAQDNNPQQDRIVKTLLRNMLSGETDGRARTVLVVGDMKQSIFRFQGAEPKLFLGLHDELGAWAEGSFKAVDILHSFRSGRHVLETVDQVFMDVGLAREVTGSDADWLGHVPVAKDRPSRVEVWPLVQEGQKVELGAWALPQERFAAQGDGGDVVCFRQVGEWLKRQIAEGVVMPSTGKSLRFEDVMVVVQRNKVAGLAAGVFRRMGIPAVVEAGMVPQAVMDVVALCRVVFNRRDRIALATVLKGVCGWDDAKLLALAARAGDGGWWEALEGREKDWLEGLAQRLPLEVVMEGMRAVGGAIEVFEPLLAWAEEAPHMAELIARLEREDLPVAASGRGVRILTVHGAKGLQAPLVILPDTMTRLEGGALDKLVWGDECVMTRLKKGVSAFADALGDVESARKREDSLRGLYVAMTRASDWLVVCGWGKEGGNGDTWWRLIDAQALEERDWRVVDGTKVRGEDFARHAEPLEVSGQKRFPAWLDGMVNRPLVGGGAE